MAVFSNLYDVGKVIAQRLLDGIVDPPLSASSVMVSQPPEQPEENNERIRISLVWTTEQPAHANDTWHRNFSGSETPAPLTISAFFLVTTYGSTGTTTGSEVIRALQLLGDVLRVFHDRPTARLPMATLPGKGEGDLDVRVVPMAPDLLEKLFSPLQIKHRPFALVEAGPVQLVSRIATRPPAPLVRPGGMRLSHDDPTPQARPSVARIFPSPQAVGGRIRIEGSFPETPTRIWVGTSRIEGAEITVIDPQRSVSVLLPTLPPDEIGPGVHNVSVLAGPLPSEPVSLPVVAASEATLDAPTTLVQSRAANLVLSGRHLDGAFEVVAWPDAPVSSPDEVLSLVPTVTPASVTVASAALASLGNRAYRFAVRLPPHRYTPYVVLEVRP